MSSVRIQNSTDEALIDMICRAEYRVEFYAPGVSLPVAKALVRKVNQFKVDAMMESLSGDADRRIFRVALDVSGNTIRLGLGEAEAAKLLWVAEHAFCKSDKERWFFHASKLRLGYLTVDDRTLFFAPVARLMEEDYEELEQECLNSFCLQTVPALPNGFLDGLRPVADCFGTAEDLDALCGRSAEELLEEREESEDIFDGAEPEPEVSEFNPSLSENMEVSDSESLSPAEPMRCDDMSEDDDADEEEAPEDDDADEDGVPEEVVADDGSDDDEAYDVLPNLLRQTPGAWLDRTYDGDSKIESLYRFLNTAAQFNVPESKFDAFPQRNPILRALTMAWKSYPRVTLIPMEFLRSWLHSNPYYIFRMSPKELSDAIVQVIEGEQSIQEQKKQGMHYTCSDREAVESFVSAVLGSHLPHDCNSVEGNFNYLFDKYMKQHLS